GGGGGAQGGGGGRGGGGRGHGGGGGGHPGTRGDQRRGGARAVHERLHPAGQRHPPRHADVAHGRGHLGHDTPHQLQPRQPHHDGTGLEHRRRLEPVGEQRRRGHGVRNGQAGHRHQADRRPDQQDEQHDG